jgi:hypothetical protein
VTQTANADVITAVQAWWSTRADLQALVTGGKLWHGTVAEDASVEPYANYFLVSTTAVTPTTGYIYYESVVQFNVYHYLPGLAQILAFQLSKAMNTLSPGGGAQLFIEGQDAVHVLPEDFGLEEGEGLGLNGRDCWMAHFTVSIPWTN